MATTLHMFAGSVTGTNATTPGRVWDTALPGVTTDVRPEACPDVVADYQALPFPAGTFTGVVADPPYADHWAGEWHVLPRPKRILLEAARVTKPGGLVAILHLIVIPAYRVAGVERVAIHPILAGPNNAVRVLNVFRTAP